LSFPPLPTTDAMNSARADPHHPNLRIGNALAQLIACLELIGINLVHSAFNVDRGKLAIVVGFELRADFFS
jgi:hypothetical protein